MLTARRKGLRSSVSRSISESKTFGVRGGEGKLVQGIGVTRSTMTIDRRMWVIFRFGLSSCSRTEGDRGGCFTSRHCTELVSPRRE
jgi:hypothetical protein